MKNILLGASLLVCLPFLLSGQEQQFTGHYLFTSAVSKIFAVTAGDLDQDGRTDILFTEPDGSGLRWLKNESSGVFTLLSASDFPAIGVRILDLDTDGSMDILACSYDDNRVALLKNDGTQNFSVITLSDSVTHPLTLDAGDVDGDGDTDIAVSTQDAGTGIVLMVNNGDNTFTPRRMTDASRNSTWVEITDLDKDGDQDILGNHFAGSGGVLWYEQTYPLVFVEHLISYPMAHGGAAGDLDGDGDVDLAAAACGSSVAWFENDGTNSFTKHNLVSGLGCAVSVGFADINSDSLTDIIMVGWSANKIAWCENTGAGTFINHTVCDTLVQPSDLCLSDVNGDGNTDILTGSYSRELAWFENRQQGTSFSGAERKPPFIIKKNHETGEMLLIFRDPPVTTARIDLYDLMGRRVLWFPRISTSEPFPLQAPGSGLYLLNIILGEQHHTQKVLF
jgi:hypothetical protein